MIGRLKDKPTPTCSCTAQLDLLDFRAGKCAFAASTAAQGSIYLLIIASCRTHLTRQRIDQLGRYLHSAEGDMACPMPAP